MLAIVGCDEYVTIVAAQSATVVTRLRCEHARRIRCCAWSVVDDDPKRKRMQLVVASDERIELWLPFEV